jgi:steroid delta-isomerase-like uncharacterized protein
MTVETNKKLVLAAIDAVNRNDVDEAVAFDATDLLLNGEPFGLAADRQRCLMMAAAFPDGRWVIDDVVAEGEKVVLRYTFRGTHQGDLMGIPPTGKAISLTGMSIYRIVDGMLVEFWESLDRLGLYQQLGLVPA